MEKGRQGHKIQIERPIANRIKQYCLENDMSLSRFFEIAIINAFMKYRFKAITALDDLEFHLPKEVLDMIDLIRGPRRRAQVIREIIMVVLDDIDLLPKKSERHNFLREKFTGTPHDILQQKLEIRLKKRRDNPAKNLQIKDNQNGQENF